MMQYLQQILEYHLHSLLVDKLVVSVTTYNRFSSKQLSHIRPPTKAESSVACRDAEDSDHEIALLVCT